MSSAGFRLHPNDERVIGAFGLATEGRICMASSGKKKTTMAKLQREGRLRERRLDKQARKNARKLAAANPVDPHDELLTPDGQAIDGEAAHLVAPEGAAHAQDEAAVRSEGQAQEGSDGSAAPALEGTSRSHG